MKAWMIFGAFITIYIGITVFNIISKQRFLALKNEYNKMTEDRELYGEYGIDEVSFMKKQMFSLYILYMSTYIKRDSYTRKGRVVIREQRNLIAAAGPKGKELTTYSFLLALYTIFLNYLYLIGNP